MMNSVVETANGSRSVGESVGQRVGRVDQRYKKAKPQPNHTACATVRNWRNWTIIIKYHHFVTIKGIWKFFCFFSPTHSLFFFFSDVVFFFFFFSPDTV